MATKSSVNSACVYTKPTMRKKLFEKIKGQAVQGTGAGEWSARKAQLLAKTYKAKGGGYKS
jgi:hypothetical protein